MRLAPCIAALLVAAAAGCGGDDVPRRGERDSGARPDTGPPPGRDAGADAAPDPDDPALLARAAVVISSCLGGSAGALLFDAYGSVAAPGSFPKLLRDHAVCLATAGTGCDALDTCLGLELDVPGECVPGCDADGAASYCGSGHVRWRCADVGLACIGGECVADGGDCTDTTCEGGVPVVCTDGTAARGPDCGAHGLVCEMAAGADPGCRGGGEACEPATETSVTVQWFDNSIECAGGDTLVTCINGGRYELACADIADGMRCRTTTDVDARAFCGLANECNPFTTVVEYCSGDDVSVCNAGRLERVSCFDLGFERCVSGSCT